jgi:hypothetical protein
MARYQQKTIINFGNSVDVARYQQQRQWQQVGQISNKIGNMAFKYLEKEVGEQATIAGMMAGQSGKPSLKKGFTTYDNAYDKAAITAYKSSSEVDIIKRSAELREEYKNDPDGMANAYKGWSKGMRETLDPELFQVWQSVHQAYFKNDIGRALAGKQKEDFDANVATVVEGIDVRSAELFDASYRGDDDTASFLRISLLGDLGLAQENGLLSEAQVIKYVAKLDREDASNQFLGEFNRTLQSDGGLEKGKEMLDNFMESDVSAEDLGMSHLEMQAKLETALNKEIRLRKAEEALTKAANKVQIAQAKSQVKSVATLLNNGIPVSKDEGKAALDNFRWLDPVEQRKFIDATRRGKDINEFLQHSVGERSEILKTLPLEEQARYNKAVENFESELKDKGVQFLDTFFGQDFQPIDLSKLSKSDEQAIADRMDRVAQYEKTLDRIIPLVTPGEAGEISRGLNLMLNQEDADYKGMMERITSVNDLFGDRSMEVWQDIAEDKQSGIYAVIGDLAQTETGKVTSQSILRGMTMQQTQPKITGLEGVVSAAIGSAYGDNMVATAAYRQAVQAIISLRAQNDPIDENNAKNIDPDMLNTAITQVTGGIYEGSVMTWGSGMMGSYRVVLPTGRDEEWFEEFLDNPPNSAVEGMALPTNTFEAKKERLANSILVPEGPGRYYVKTIGRSGIAIGINSIYKDDKGNPLPFILDANL